jgi:hypothetical protein
MDRTTLKGRPIAVLRQIQADGRLECPPLTGATKPRENLPKFDSKVWPIATTILATSRKKSPARDQFIPPRTADNKLALQPPAPARAGLAPGPASR